MLLAIAIFATNAACRPCHPALVDAYSRTPMANSSGRVEPLSRSTFNAGGFRYEVAGKTLNFDGGSSSIDYFIGSNAAGRTYLRERNGFLFELPVTWYSQKKTWDASPGYEHELYVRLNRPIELSCLLCHSSQVRPVLNTQNRYGDPPFIENGVTCERCHGPGSEHVRDPAKSRMANPAKLEAERRDSVCSQCHLSGEARIERAGHRIVEFQAGEKLADYATYLVWEGGRRDLKVTSHVEKLAASACKLSSGDKLWCGTCHDPHTNTDKSQQACLSCHPVAHRQEEQCATCHMPKTLSADAGHGVMTDHSIPRRPRAAAPPEKSNLVAFGSGVADDRALGLAYAEIGDTRAREYLLRATPADWQVRLRLAVLEPDISRAASLYESVLREKPGETSALVNLGAIYASAGRRVDAARLWERALAANPGLEEAVLNLSLIRPPQEAIGLVTNYLQLNPASPAAKGRLNQLQK